MLLGYKGLITNVILIGLGYFLAPWFLGFQSAPQELTLPVPILALLALLLVAERKTNLNVLAVEFSALQDVHHQRWKRFMRSWYFGLLLLMAVIWRSYFRLILIVFPLLNWVYDSMDIRYDALPWYGRMPYWLCGLLVAAGQLWLIADVLEPPQVKVSPGAELVSRVFNLILLTFFMSQFYLLFKSVLIPWNPATTASQILLGNLLFLSIIFTFFYIPIRFVDMVSDLTDCRTRVQAVLFWLSCAMAMVETLRPGILQALFN